MQLTYFESFILKLNIRDLDNNHSLAYYSLLILKTVKINNFKIFISK